LSGQQTAACRTGFSRRSIIHLLVGYPDLLHVLVWVWTLAELFIGIGLILGLFTRLFGLGSLLINIPLMVIFGWMGSTCVDEWTMAAAGFAMGATLMIGGGGPWSLDHFFERRHPGFFRIPGVALIGSGDIPALRT